MERLTGGTTTGSETCKQENVSGGGRSEAEEEDGQAEDMSFLEPESVLESALVQEPYVPKGKTYHQHSAASSSSQGAGKGLLSCAVSFPEEAVFLGFVCLSFNRITLKLSARLS